MLVNFYRSLFTVNVTMTINYEVGFSLSTVTKLTLPEI